MEVSKKNQILSSLSNDEKLKNSDSLKKITEHLDIIQKDFLSESCNETETLGIIKKNYEEI